MKSHGVMKSSGAQICDCDELNPQMLLTFLHLNSDQAESGAWLIPFDLEGESTIAASFIVCVADRSGRYLRDRHASPSRRETSTDTGRNDFDATAAHLRTQCAYCAHLAQIDTLQRILPLVASP